MCSSALSLHREKLRLCCCCCCQFVVVVFLFVRFLATCFMLISGVVTILPVSQKWHLCPHWPLGTQSLPGLVSIPKQERKKPVFWEVPRNVGVINMQSASFFPKVKDGVFILSHQSRGGTTATASANCSNVSLFVFLSIRIH